MKRTVFFTTLAFLAMFSACKKDNQEVLPDSNARTNDGIVFSHGDSSCHEVVSEFYAGQHIPAGTITVSNDESNVYVTFNTENGWEMGTTHLYVGFEDGLPVGKSGNPKIGNFPFQTNHSPMQTTYTYIVPMDEFVLGDCIVIAAHAEVFLVGPDGEVVDSQTAWGGTQPIREGGSWATYIEYCICKNPVIGG